MTRKTRKNRKIFEFKKKIAVQVAENVPTTIVEKYKKNIFKVASHLLRGVIIEL